MAALIANATAQTMVWTQLIIYRTLGTRFAKRQGSKGADFPQILNRDIGTRNTRFETVSEFEVEEQN